MSFIKGQRVARQRYSKQELQLLIDATNEGLNPKQLVVLLAKHGFHRTEPSIIYISRKLTNSQAKTLDDFIQGKHKG